MTDTQETDTPQTEARTLDPHLAHVRDKAEALKAEVTRINVALVPVLAKVDELMGVDLSEAAILGDPAGVRQIFQDTTPLLAQLYLTVENRSGPFVNSEMGNFGAKVDALQDALYSVTKRVIAVHEQSRQFDRAAREKEIRAEQYRLQLQRQEEAHQRRLLGEPG